MFVQEDPRDLELERSRNLPQEGETGVCLYGRQSSRIYEGFGFHACESMSADELHDTIQPFYAAIEEDRVKRIETSFFPEDRRAQKLLERTNK